MKLREREGKAAPPARPGALSPDLTAHRLRQRLGDRQADAGSSESARTRLVEAIEGMRRVPFQLLA